MKTFETTSHFPSEDLHYLLPQSIRDFLEDKDPHFASPTNLKTKQDPDLQLPQTTPSPQIPPLESRLHSYLLKQPSIDDLARPCNLSQFFNNVCINDEIQIALKEIPQRIKLFDFLESSSFFEQVKTSVINTQKSAKSRLNAQATSFIPDANKENLCSKYKLSNR